TLKNCWRPLTNVDYELSDKMTTYLTNFVKTGNPNSDDLIKWDSTLEKTKKALHLGNGYIGMKKLNKAKLWHSMLTNKAVGE
ncbi:MAG: carboxylesterase family protein, partial [Acholeplasmatales bacterium]|nr:carboxylesterase family protein [Acholeplasmatales bacterium]